jgi:predicted nucleotidyltransferase
MQDQIRQQYDSAKAAAEELYNKNQFHLPEKRDEAISNFAHASECSPADRQSANNLKQKLQSMINGRSLPYDVILHGSLAYGTATKTSDLDLYILNLGPGPQENVVQPSQSVIETVEDMMKCLRGTLAHEVIRNGRGVLLRYKYENINVDLLVTNSKGVAEECRRASINKTAVRFLKIIRDNSLHEFLGVAPNTAMSPENAEVPRSHALEEFARDIMEGEDCRTLVDFSLALVKRVQKLAAPPSHGERRYDSDLNPSQWIKMWAWCDVLLDKWH